LVGTLGRLGTEEKSIVSKHAGVLNKYSLPQKYKDSKGFLLCPPIRVAKQTEHGFFSKQALLCAIKLYGGVDGRLGIGD